MKKRTLFSCLLCISFFTVISQSRIQEDIRVSLQTQLDLFQYDHARPADIIGNYVVIKDAEDLGKNKSLIQIKDSTYEWIWDLNNVEWKIYGKEVDIAYDNNNNLTSYKRQTWNGINWENSQMRSYTYDANNNLLSYKRQYWNNDNWNNDEQYIYTYDANNNLSNELLQDWFDNNWENYFQYIYTYDANDSILSYLVQWWYVDDWVNIQQRTYTFDVNNRIGELWQNWDGVGWENYAQSSYTYDVNNNRISKLSQEWNDTEWENTWQLTYTYDANHNRISELSQEWKDNEWEYWSRSSYSYDVNNNMISYERQRWYGGNWFIDEQSTYTYDANNFLLSYADKYWDLQGTYIYDGDSTYYYFHTENMGAEDLTALKDGIVVYPNPSSNQITIDLPNIPQKNTMLTIYTINSQKVHTQEITKKQTTIDVSMLQPGVFLLEVVTDRTRAIQKLIVR